MKGGGSPHIIMKWGLSLQLAQVRSRYSMLYSQKKRDNVSWKKTKNKITTILTDLLPKTRTLQGR